MLVRKRKTGRFLATPAEIVAQRKESLAKAGAGKPLIAQARFWSLPFALLGFLVYFGVLVAVAVLQVGSCSSTLTALLLILSGAFLFLPGIFIIKAVRRRIKAGHFLPGAEEMTKVSGGCSPQTSRRQRIGSAILWTLIAMLWTYSACAGTAMRHGGLR